MDGSQAGMLLRWDGTAGNVQWKAYGGIILEKEVAQRKTVCRYWQEGKERTSIKVLADTICSIVLYFVVGGGLGLGVTG